jgi:hypothetical protein
MLQKMLKETVIQTAKDYYDVDRAERWWFLHDNSPPFKSGIVQTWLYNKCVHVLEWPPNSPDLNPIENIWPRVAAIMDKMHPKTDQEVEEAFLDAWQQIPLDVWTDYAPSMPERIRAVIDANGDSTKY